MTLLTCLLTNLSNSFDWQILTHLDAYLTGWIVLYGNWIYLFLFLIIFCETGLIIMPFLPGDSLLFMVGMVASQGHIKLLPTLGLLCLAACLGNIANYAQGKYIGKKLFEKGVFKFLVDPVQIEKSQHLYTKYGSYTIILGRFLPLVRTFIPFMAGVVRMAYFPFILYSFFGGVFWIVSLMLMGYYLGHFSFVREYLGAFILFVVSIVLLPMLYKVLRYLIQHILVKIKENR